MKRGLNKRGVIADYLPWIIIAVIVLTLIMISIFYLKGQGFSLIDKLKNIGRTGLWQSLL